MSKPTLIIREPGRGRREAELSGDVSIGSAEGNRVRIKGDPNVAPHHVLVERRGEAYWLINLVFARRTTLGGEPLATERQLQDGDSVCLGGTSFVEFHADGPPPEDEDENEEGVAVHAGTGSRRTDGRSSTNRDRGGSGGGSQPPPVGLKWPYVALAGVCAVVLVGGCALLLFNFVGRGCDGSVRIISPRSGSTITKPVEILAEAKERRCVERVVYKLNNTEVGRAEAPPYRVTLDPAAFRHLSGAGRLVLTATVEAGGGRKQLQPGEVLLAFGAGDSKPAPQSTPVVGPTAELLPTPVSATSVGVPEIQAMSMQLAGQITTRGGYVFDREFAMLILARTEEFKRGGYTERVRPLRSIVNKAFTDQGESPLLGYVLAFSRSRFDARAGGGIWRLPPTAVRNYLAPGETADVLSDPQRSADIAALYTKALVRAFEHGDFMYAVACFGQTRDEAGALRTELARVAPDDSVRLDFWKVVKLNLLKPEQRQQVVDFFAAGVVAENPEAFGLVGETRFSHL
ncbi:MAG TPA: Ig-like domain-containing protein [Pyrinomonadaceae bacterium]|jgi:hypothetical protein